MYQTQDGRLAGSCSDCCGRNAARRTGFSSGRLHECFLTAAAFCTDTAVGKCNKLIGYDIANGLAMDITASTAGDETIHPKAVALRWPSAIGTAADYC